MNWDATASLSIFQKFHWLSEFWLKDQKVPNTDQCIKIIYLLGLTLMWQSFGRDDNNDYKDPSKF